MRSVVKGSFLGLRTGMKPADNACAAIPEVLDEDIVRVLELWRSANRTSTKKYMAMLQRMAADGRIRDVLLNDWDPMGLQDAAVPPDDYDDVAREVHAILTGPEASTERVASIASRMPAANTSAPPTTIWNAARRNGVSM